MNLGRHAEAVAQYDAILTVARNAPYRADIALSAAQVTLDSIDTETGLARLKAVAENYPGTSAAWAAQEQLSRHGTAFDGFRRGQAAFVAGDAQAAIEALNQFAAAQDSTAIPAELYLLLGRAYRQIGNFAGRLGRVPDADRPLSARSAPLATRCSSAGGRAF